MDNRLFISHFLTGAGRTEEVDGTIRLTKTLAGLQTLREFFQIESEEILPGVYRFKTMPTSFDHPLRQEAEGLVLDSNNEWNLVTPYDLLHRIVRQAGLGKVLKDQRSTEEQVTSLRQIALDAGFEESRLNMLTLKEANEVRRIANQHGLYDAADFLINKMLSEGAPISLTLERRQ